MNITKTQLKKLIKEEITKVLLESSRAGEAHDAGYEDGSRGVDPAQPDDMDYMSGWEMGEEDAQHDAEQSFRGPDPATHKRLRQQTRAQGGYSGRGAWKSRTPNK